MTKKKERDDLDGRVFAFLMFVSDVDEFTIVTTLARLHIGSQREIKRSLARLMRRGLLFRHALPSGAALYMDASHAVGDIRGTGWLLELAEMPEVIATHRKGWEAYRSFLQDRFQEWGRRRRRHHPTFWARLLKDDDG